MKKYIKWILITILFLMLYNSNKTTEAVTFSCKICINNLFPSLFPILIISNMLSQYGFVDICSKIGQKIMNKLFYVDKNGAYILFLSMLSGSPSNAKYINDLLNNHLITIEDANQLLLFTHFVNPIFIINGIGISFLHDKMLGYIILVSHFIGSLIIGLLLRKKKQVKNIETIMPFKKKNFINILTDSIQNTINTLFLILGVVTTFLILTSLLNEVFHLNTLIGGLLEITQGIKYISTSHFSYFLKTILITFIISFGGFSIHMQVMSILEDKKIRYIPYLNARLLHAVISSIISIILFVLVY